MNYTFYCNYMNYFHITSCVVVIGFSVCLSWIRLFVPSLWKLSTCPFFILHVKRAWTHYSMPKSTCKYLFVWISVNYLTFCLFRHTNSAKGAVIRKISVINKNLFHLIDDIFWNLGFTNETHAEKVIRLIRITRFLSLISNVLTKLIWPILIDPGHSPGHKCIFYCNTGTQGIARGTSAFVLQHLLLYFTYYYITYDC